MVFLLFFIAGVFFWTFLEYVIHRFFGHQVHGKNIVKKEHGRHHAEINYFAPLSKKLVLSVIVLVISTFLVGLFFNNLLYGFVFSFGLASMYMLYEITHRRFHVAEPLIRFGLRMRMHHFYHHFMNPSKNHGVTTAFWDRVFGTFEKTEAVYLPGKVVLPWLVDESAEIKDKYRNKFIYRGNKH
jgi:sterol desaturase/sphingolipid hydroxylase (fatty acid hydroxylase superfamily)